MSDPKPAHGNPFSVFASSAYERQQVAKACTALRDRQGLDVNFLLLAAFAGKQGFELDARQWERLEKLIAPWRADVVQSLRRARGRVIAEPSLPDAIALTMRRAILEQEIESEVLQRHLMWAALKIPPGEPSPACAARNLAAYCRFARVAINGRDAEALQILALEAMPPRRAPDQPAPREKRRGRRVAIVAIICGAIVSAGAAAWVNNRNHASQPSVISTKALETATTLTPPPESPATSLSAPAPTVASAATPAPPPEPDSATPVPTPAALPSNSTADPPASAAPETHAAPAPATAAEGGPPQPVAPTTKPLSIAQKPGTAETPSAARVAEAQRLLRSLGYDPGTASGNITPKTSGAVKAFEKKQGMARDGNVTIDLLKALRNAWTQRDAAAKEHFAAGLRALDAKRYDEALKELKAGIALEDDAVAAFHLGEAYQALGNGKAAGEAFRRSISLDPKSPVAERAKGAIEEMRAAEAKALQPPAAGDGRAATTSPAAANKGSPQGAWVLQYTKLFSSGGGGSKIKENLTISGNTASAVAEVSSQITDKARKVRGCPDGTYLLSYTLEAKYNVEPVPSGSALVLHSIGPLVVRNVSPPCFNTAPPDHQDEVLRWDGSSLFGENGRYERAH